MRELILFACRAFPREHRARRSDEIVDTALLAAGSSRWRAAREALSLVLAGARQRALAESHRSVRDGAALLAGVLALVNLAVALAGMTASVHLDSKLHVYLTPSYGPYVVDGWWIAFTVAAVATVIGLAIGNRPLAFGAALVNFGTVAYDAIFLVGGSPYDGRGHLDVFTYTQTSSFPAGREWLAAAAVLALATAPARPRRLPLARLPFALVVAMLLVALSRGTWGGFFFLRHVLAAIVVLALLFGALAPRLAVLAIGVTLAAVPSAVGYLTASNLHHHPSVTGLVAAGLALGAVLPMARLVRRRVT
jgi:hypothetical protein